jgi:DNA primase small subunit
MNPATLEFLKRRFSGYYQESRLIIPPSLEQREWGFIFFDLSQDVRMRRHIAFGSRNEVTGYLRTMVPAHTFFSTAYYDLPSAPTMHDKIWTGADLIFDLDADHIVRGPYAMMLARVKEETQKLLGMLIEELGFARKDISIVFSGGRGYHVHVRDIAVREWGSPQRRELVDYVCGIGLDPGIMLEAPASGAGWPSRYRGALIEMLGEMAGLGGEAALARLTALDGVAEKSAQAFLGSLSGTLAALGQSDRPFHAGGRVLRALLLQEDGELRARLNERAALTDEPVTTDIKRLIRMPGSLHGGSGLRVTPVSYSDLDDFDPLIDAVVFGDTEVRVELAQPIPYPVSILGNDYVLAEGVNRVPEALAVFLCCRGMAEYAGGV